MHPMFKEKQLQIIRDCARKSGRSLVALMAHWHKICEVTEGMDFHMETVYVHAYGGIRVHGVLSGLPAILGTGGLHTTPMSGTIWSDDDGICGTVLARIRETNCKLHVENNVLDFILHREKLNENA